MIRHLRHAARTLRRLARPGVVLALVLAQCVATFGYPVVVRAGEAVRRCGCKVRGPSEACCCGPRDCCGGVPAPPPTGCEAGAAKSGGARTEQPPPEPEPPTCPKCKVTPAAKPAPKKPTTVTWVPGMKARQCHGDGPLGLLLESPAVPPDTSARAPAGPVLLGVVPIRDDRRISHAFISPDPPPRCG